MGPAAQDSIQPAATDQMDRQLRPVGLRGWRTIVVAALLAAVAIAWTAYPLDTGRAGTRILVIIAIAAGALSLAHLVVLAVPEGPASDIVTIPERYAGRLLALTRALPWAELLLVALLALEALHPARPWHTGVLALALLGYLFAVHLAETGGSPGALQPQLPILAAGIGLLALAIGAAALPALTPGPTAEAIRILAVVAAVIAGALAVPVGGSRD
jgi:hypothetical protein